MEARLIEHAPARGTWNMAVDEALLESATEQDITTLRFYGWDQATLSLGYFQSSSARASHPASAGCPLVRRTTGGGAIVHDRELTYSLVAPARSGARGAAERLYEALHQALVEVLAAYDVPAQRQAASHTSLGRNPFLCFQTRSPGDVLVQGQKVLGSAQRRSRHAVLQHGSLLLSRSEQAPELPGIEQLAGILLTQSDVARRWADRAAAMLQVQWTRGILSQPEQERARTLEAAKFGQTSWTCRR